MTAEFPLAVHALVYLMHKGRVTSSQELAENICTNPARVRKVMTKLHQAGLIEAMRGKGSGYLFEGDGTISLNQVLDALEEKPIAMNWKSGNVDMDCLVASGMGAIMDDLYTELNEECKKKLTKVTIGALNEQIFGKKEA